MSSLAVGFSTRSCARRGTRACSTAASPPATAKTVRLDPRALVALLDPLARLVPSVRKDRRVRQGLSVLLALLALLVLPARLGRMDHAVLLAAPAVTQSSNQHRS